MPKEPGTVQDYEATIILRVSARSSKDAVRELRRQLIKLATKRNGGTLAQSLQITRPVVTQLTRR